MEYLKIKLYFKIKICSLWAALQKIKLEFIQCYKNVINIFISINPIIIIMNCYEYFSVYMWGNMIFLKNQEIIL